MSQIFFKRFYVFLMLSMCLVCAMQIFAQEPSLAAQIFQKYQALLQREDVQEVLPVVLIELKKPENQQFLTSATINTVLDDPDVLKTLIPDTSDEFITFLKGDTDMQTMLRDPDVQRLLQDSEAIDELAGLLSVEPPSIVVSIVPASIESPDIGEQLSIAVDIANAQNVAGYQLSLQFDSEALQYISWEQGSYLPDDIFSLPTIIRADKVILASTARTAADATQGTLLRITFKVVAVKTSTLSLSDVILSSSLGTALLVTTEDGEIVEPPTSPWDVNEDGVINILDLTLVAANFGQTGPTPADVNGDNMVNILDLTLVASHFGE